MKTFSVLAIATAFLPCFTHARRDNPYRLIHVAKSSKTNASAKAEKGPLESAKGSKETSSESIIIIPINKPSKRPATSSISPTYGSSPSQSFPPTNTRTNASHHINIYTPRPTIQTSSMLERPTPLEFHFSIYSRYTDKLITIEDGRCAEGTLVQLQIDIGEKWQHWKFNDIDYSFESMHCPGMALDLQDGDISECVNGVPLVISRKIDSKSQHWFVRQQGLIENMMCRGMMVETQKNQTIGTPKIYVSRVYFEQIESEWNQIWQLVSSNSTFTSSPLPSFSPTIPPTEVPTLPQSSYRYLRSPKASKRSASPASVMFPSGDCDDDECLNPFGECGYLTHCFVDPCTVSTCGGDKPVCQANYCGGCHAVCTAVQ